MQVKIQQMLFNNTVLSWQEVGQQLGRNLLKLGHEVSFFSTDGIKDQFVPSDLKPFVRKQEPKERFDLAVSYTMLKNFPRFLANADKKIGIYNIDSMHLSPIFIKYHQYCDYFCPSSNFSAEIFKKNGVPENKTHVIPHGIDLQVFENKEKYPLKTKKSFKFFWNLATPHLRKNIKDTLKIWCKAFEKTDDVCLVIRVNKEAQKNPAYVDFPELLKFIKEQYQNSAEIEVIYNYVPNMVTLYNACDAVIMFSNFECFSLPCLECLSASKILIAANWGGQLHFLNDKNSLLVDGKVVMMPRNYYYWGDGSNPKGEMFSVSIDEAVDKLRFVYHNKELLMNKFSDEMKKTSQEFTWENATKKLLNLVG